MPGEEPNNEWKRKKVFDWANKGVGKTTIRQDMKNMWDRLSIQNMDSNEKVVAFLYNYKAYLPTKLWEKEALIEYITKVTQKNKGD